MARARNQRGWTSFGATTDIKACDTERVRRERGGGGGGKQLKKQKLGPSRRYLTKQNRLHSWGRRLIPKRLKRRNCKTRGAASVRAQWEERGAGEGINHPRPTARSSHRLANSSSRSRAAQSVSTAMSTRTRVSTCTPAASLTNSRLLFFKCTWKALTAFASWLRK